VFLKLIEDLTANAPKWLSFVSHCFPLCMFFTLKHSVPENFIFVSKLERFSATLSAAPKNGAQEVVIPTQNKDCEYVLPPTHLILLGITCETSLEPPMNQTYFL